MSADRHSSASILGTLLPGFVGTTLPGWLRDRLAAGLAGVCLFAPNVTSPAQLRRLTDAVHAANPEAIVAMDEEGGDVTRLFADVGSPSPGNALLGRIDDSDLTRRTAARIGRQLGEAGVDVDFAPCVDVNSRADNPVIGVRSFGGDAERVARHGTAWIAGLQATGVAATAKHFPGHGDTAQDSHVALPLVDRSREQLRERELVPFVAAAEAGVALMMTSHLMLPQVDPASPATMSRTLLTDLLRTELGFTGVVVSDALDMAGARAVGGVGAAAVRSLAAGCDLLCLGTENTDEELGAIETAVGVALAAGRLDPGRLSVAGDRVRGLRAHLAETRRAAAAVAPAAADEPVPVDDAVLIEAFDIQPDGRRWRGRLAEVRVIVVLESSPNIAVGPTPWGPFAAAAAHPDGAAFAAVDRVVRTPGDAARGPVPSGPVLVVGRDIARHGFARAAVDRLRTAGADVLAVDMGWPSPERRYADVATFGASRAVGAALLSWLAGSG